MAEKVCAFDPSKLNLLVVEDDVFVRWHLSGELRQAGYVVREAGNGDSAKTLLDTDMPVDLVCTDIRMPGVLDGNGLTRWIKLHRPEIPVILVSGVTTARYVPTVADATITKPVDVAELMREIRFLASPLNRHMTS